MKNKQTSTPESMKAHLTKQYKDNNFQNDNKIIRIGNEVYEIVNTIRADNARIKELHQRSRVVIKERKGDRFLTDTPYYDGFCNLPSHFNYQQIVDNGQNGLYNKYHQLPYDIEKGAHPTWDTLINHIGGEQAPLLWDYLRILWQRPTQILPVLCLISETQHTGKSTLGNALTYLFGPNAYILTQNELNSQFNFWAGGLIAVFEEISDTKRAINLIKTFSTAKRVILNEKHVKQISIDCFLKIIILSNNEDTFIQANKTDIRYWILKLHKFKDFDPEFEDKLKEEVKHVAWTLQNTNINTPRKSRMWFDPQLIFTDALQNVVLHSRSECAKSLEVWIEDKILEKDGSFYATASEIAKELPKFTGNQITQALQKELGYSIPERIRYDPIDGSGRKQGRAYHFQSCDNDSNGDVLSVLKDVDPNDPNLPF